MKIVITGGMGYIASALIELYRQTPEHQIVAVDRRFLPERVAALPANARFVHGDVGDAELMRPLLTGADVLHVLNAEVEAERSADRAAAVWHGNFEVPKQLIELASPSTHILFASSGNVFGGLGPDDEHLDLTEAHAPAPKLPYAESKRAVEELLLGRDDRRFTILRFGTNYGWAPGVRFNLVTNIFIRRALMGEDLTVHGAGDNHRPTCCTKDCARALLFLSAPEQAGRVEGEIFHVVSKSYTIRGLAEAVLTEVGGDAKLVMVDRPVPFSGYALSAAKIERLGFRFEWPLGRAIEEMRHQLRAMLPPP